MKSRTYKAFGAAPFVRTRITTGDLMYLVVLALLPCAGVGIYRYGFHAALLIGSAVGTAIVCELVCGWIWHSRTSSVMDYSCVVTGLIGGLILPPRAPLWAGAALSGLAIVLFKHAFGGLGKNLLNPAMSGKCVLLLLCREMMTDLTTPAYATLPPLELLQSGETPSLWDMLTGNIPGGIGTSSALAVLAAVIILFLAGLLDLTIPLAAMASFSVCYVLIGRYGMSPYTLAIQLCGGSFLFTVFIMAEDFTTTPVSRSARILYGIILGGAAFVFRKLGLYEDGVVYALLLVNLLRPLLDKKLAQKPFGTSAKKWVIKESRGQRRTQAAPVLEKAAAPRKNAESIGSLIGKKNAKAGRPETKQPKTAPEKNRKPEQKTERKTEKTILATELTNEQIDEEFRRFQEIIEKEARGLETARYTGDDTLLREAYAEAEASRKEEKK